MNQADTSYPWREYFSRLSLCLDQAAVYCMSSTDDMAKQHVDEARNIVESMRRRLESTAVEAPTFSRAPEQGPVLGSSEITAIGALTEALHSRDLETRRTGSDSLIPMLNRLRPEDVRFLNEYQRGNLTKFLRIEFASAHADLMVAILQALARIGDMNALKPIENLAKGFAASREGKRVKAEAETCRIQLETLKARTEMSQKLLRPTAAPKDGSAFLRPAHGLPGTEDSALLRSVSERTD